MHWTAALENPQSITSLFGEPSALDLIDLHEVTVHREGPVLRLRFDIPAVPAPLPRKWPAGANTTQLVLAAWGVTALQISGWATRVQGQLEVERRDSETLLIFTSPNCRIEASVGELRIETVSGYIDGSRA